MLFAFRIAKLQTKNKLNMKKETSNETETDNSIKPDVKSSFSREEVIRLLDWLRSSRFHNQGCNGWNQYGHSAYYGVGSDYVLREGEKNCF